jgi:hypothetical protein
MANLFDRDFRIKSVGKPAEFGEGRRGLAENEDTGSGVGDSCGGTLSAAAAPAVQTRADHGEEEGVGAAAAQPCRRAQASRRCGFGAAGRRSEAGDLCPAVQAPAGLLEVRLQRGDVDGEPPRGEQHGLVEFL